MNGPAARPVVAMLSGIRAAIIDLDGTMLDTAPDFLVAINRMREEFSLAPLALERIKLFVGKGSENLIRRVLAVDFDAPQVEQHFEPEDHAEILCEIMAGLAGEQIAAPAEAEREIFELHLAPWIGRFCADLERAESARFYARVGALGRTFVEIETTAFTLPASRQVR